MSSTMNEDNGMRKGLWMVPIVVLVAHRPSNGYQYALCCWTDGFDRVLDQPVAHSAVPIGQRLPSRPPYGCATYTLDPRPLLPLQTNKSQYRPTHESEGEDKGCLLASSSKDSDLVVQELFSKVGVSLGCLVSAKGTRYLPSTR